MRIRDITYIAFLTGMSIILTRVLSIRIPILGIEGIRIGFGPLPIIIASFLLGPVEGAICGALADVVGYFINPMGPFIPIFTIISTLRGLLPGLLSLPLKKRGDSFFYYFFPIMISQIITSIILTPFSLHLIFGMPLGVILIPAVISQIILIPIYSFLVREITLLVRRSDLNEAG
ncbi:MAG: folate family ECF transporter S component [bacterium]